MIEILEEQQKKVRCLLVGYPNDNLLELKGLVYTLEMEIADSFILNKIDIQPAYGMGSGKAQEICAHAKAINADCIIMDFELDPTKQRNWEKLSKLPVFDRQETILRIFAKRALTKEAVLQVELARLEYSLPRLSHMYGEFSRQRGGNYGSKGSGETQLELDRRGVRERIAKIKNELSKVVQNREVQRKRRSKSKIKTIALCGYTNAGKSSLLNALTSAKTLVENKLFATLDPLTRKLFLTNSNYDFKEVLLTDTVGFISNLPHSLINAFRSTLEEAKHADLLLIVLDSYDPNIFLHYETILEVLKEIGANISNSLIVLNKIDSYQTNLEQTLSKSDTKLTENYSTDETHPEHIHPNSLQTDESATLSKKFLLTRIEKQFPDHVKVSAITGQGLEELKQLIFEKT